MIGIKRTTDLYRVIESIPKPKGAVPKFGLPAWKVMQLDDKIPMIPGPESAYNLARRKVGRKLWVTFKNKEFDLSDPYCHETRFAYEPLHDEHLLDFFSRPVNLKRLLKAGLITDKLDVKCSLRDYNEYRKYLRKIHADRVNKELRRRHRLTVEIKALCFAKSQAHKKAEMCDLRKIVTLKKREKFATHRQRFVQEQLLREESRNQRQREKTRTVKRRVTLLRLVKQEKRRLTNVQNEARAERVRLRCKIMTNITRRRTLDAVTNWKKREKMLETIRNARLREIKRQKQWIIEERWKEKQYLQEGNIEKQKTLLRHMETRRQKYIEDYNTKVKRETARMQKLLDNEKLFTYCYTKRRLPDGSSRICCKKYLRDKNTAQDKKKDSAKKISQNFVQSSSTPTKRKKQELRASVKGQYTRREHKHVARNPATQTFTITRRNTQELVNRNITGKRSREIVT